MIWDWKIFKMQLATLGGLLFLSLAVTWVILYYVRLLDHPNTRSSHSLATPKCGGVGIVISFVAGVYLSQLWGNGCQVAPNILYSLIAPVLLVASVSLADDIQELAPGFRLGVQVVAALMFLFLVKFASGTGVEKIYGEVWLPTKVMPLLFWLGGTIWIVGMANAFNFMDGIDGLAAGQGLLVALFFAVIQLSKGEYFLSFVSLVLAAGCLGFLAFNFPPAKVFMGDVGSISIGFILSAIALVSFQNNSNLETLLVMPLLMSNFLFDTITTFARRVLKKEPIFLPHRTHLYQKFASCGFSQRTVTMTNYGMAIIQGFVVLLVGEKILYAIAVCMGMQLLYGILVNVMYKKI